MKLAPIALLLALSTATLAQNPTFSDPANLAGERPNPLTGRELPIDQGTLGLEQLLRKLSTRASILNIVAHPDDEDGGMLTLNARGLGARVADLSLTRGEGGQNAMTGDFEDALGLLRTQELLANDRYTGVSQMFGTEVDFGFSKTKTESFSKWTHERVLYDAVRAIRIFRPLVITSTWTGGVTDGHGQHQVSGEIAQEAFLAAGDPTIFPELTREGILPWQPLKMYARVPMGAITSRGLYDYATNQYVPAEFTNYITGEKSTTPPTADILIHEGTPDPLLTVAAAKASDLPPHLASEPTTAVLSYIQFSRLGLGLQKSQIGPGFREARSGAFDVAYHLYGSCLPFSSMTERLCHLDRSLAASSRGAAERPAASSSSPTFFDGIDTSFAGIASLAPDAPNSVRESISRIAANIQQAASSLDAAHPSAVAAPLAEALQATDALLTQLDAASINSSQRASLLHELRIKRVQLNQALTLALGLTLDATAHGATQTAGSPIPVWAQLRSQAPSDLGVTKVWLQTAQGVVPPKPGSEGQIRDISSDHPLGKGLTAESGLTLTVTRPYFTRDNIENPVYKLTDAAFRNAPQTAPALTAWATLDYRGVSLTLGRVVHDGAQPVSIVPPAGIAISTHAQILPNSARSLTVSLHSETGPQDPHDSRAPKATHEKLSTPPGWSAHRLDTDSTAPGHVRYQVNAPSGARKPEILVAVASSPEGNTFTEGYRPIGYGDLPRTNYFTPATDRIVPVDLKLPTKLRIAYLPGTGDAVLEALASVGLVPTTLAVSDLTPANLAHYDTVILGVRTYNANPDLHGAPTQALLDFAKQGGNVVVQYQTDEFTAADAPYPLSLGSNAKVVDETAPVELLTAPLALGPRPSPLLTTPTRITPHDFDNWIEERGHGFLESWDSHYTALTETHDPGAPSEHVAPQTPQRGGLITTQLGKGRWTYCAFALYRQLPEANPGAFRLFINLTNPPFCHSAAKRRNLQLRFASPSVIPARDLLPPTHHHPQTQNGLPHGRPFCLNPTALLRVMNRVAHRGLRLRQHQRAVAHGNHQRLLRVGSVRSVDGHLRAHRRYVLVLDRFLHVEREVRGLRLHGIVRDGNLYRVRRRRDHRNARELGRLALHRVEHLVRIGLLAILQNELLVRNRQRSQVRCR